MLKLEENENGITDEASVFLLSMPYGGKVEGLVHENSRVEGRSPCLLSHPQHCLHGHL